MKNAMMLIAVLSLNAAAASPAKDTSYFRIAFDAAKVGMFQQMDGPRQEYGFVVPAITHDKADGYWLVPGVTWNLLDIGYSQGKRDDGSTSRAARFGPSVNLDEPVKSVMRRICRVLPGWEDDAAAYTLMRSAFKEGPDGALSMGPSFRVDVPRLDVRSWKGGLDWSFTLNKRF